MTARGVFFAEQDHRPSLADQELRPRLERLADSLPSGAKLAPVDHRFFWLAAYRAEEVIVSWSRSASTDDERVRGEPRGKGEDDGA